MPYVYVGPAKKITIGDQSFSPGDVVPMTDREVRHHRRHGHVFKDVPVASAPAPKEMPKETK